MITRKIQKLKKKVCEYCQSEFILNYINRDNKFCSKKCYLDSCKCQGRDIILECQKCHNSFTVKESLHQWKNRKFCSKSCAAKCHFGKNRSKWEALLSIELKKHFPQLTIIDNDRTTFDGLEIDIWIPELKFAIEWNGIYHYKPIFGQERLEYQQSNDNKKIALANNQNIHLIVIPAITMGKKRFAEILSNIVETITKLTDDNR